MKRSSLSVCCILTSLCLLLAGCGRPAGSPDQTAVPAPSETQPMPTGTQPAAGYDDRLITESCHEELPGEGCFYAVPSLLADTAAAAQINGALEDTVGTAAEEALEQLRQGAVPRYRSIRWESHWNGSLLSLVITMDGTERTDYAVYHYDFASGRAPDQQDLLKRVGLEESAFFAALRRSAAARTDLDLSSACEQGADLSFHTAALQRAQTISIHNLDWDQVQLFLGDSESLTAIVNLPIPGSEDVYRVPLKTEPAPSECPRLEAEYDFVHAVLENNQVTLTFRETEQSGWCFPSTAMEYHVPYPVEGLYGSYQAMDLAAIGQNLGPVLFLTDSEGRVTFCDVIGSLFCGGRFFASGPLLLPQPVVALEPLSEEGGQSMLATLADGSQVDLGALVLEAQEPCPDLLTPCTWMDEGQTHGLVLDEDGRSITWISEDGESADGTLFYGGATEYGLQFPCRLWAGQGESVGGVLQLSVDSVQVNPEGNYVVEFTQLTGPVLPGLKEDGQTELHPC